MNHKPNTITTGGALALAALALLSTAPAAFAAQQDTARQRDKNNMRNLGTGLGAGAVIEAIRGKTTHALILGAGAAYSAKKYEDQRKAQAQARDRDRRLGQNERGGARSYGEASQPIRVLVNDERVRFAGQGPEQMGERVYVPLRGVLERIGADVKWNPNQRVVVARQGDTVVRLPAGGFATVNGQRVALDAPAYVENGRTMVPLRFLSETFGAQVKWDAAEREVRISHDGSQHVSLNQR